MGSRHCVDVSTDGEGVRTVVLADPARRNALSMQMRTDLLAAVETAMADDECRCVVLRGAGSGFCAGGDLAELADVDGAPRRLEVLNRLVEQLVTGPKPVVAAVEGGAFGSGLALALASDVVVVSTTAVLAPNFTRVGLAADGGITWTLTRRVGHGPARAMLLRGEPVSGGDAVRLGMADEVCAPEEMDRVVAKVAARIAAGPSDALRALKELRSDDLGALRSALAHELTTQVRLMHGSEFAEGLAAAKERRPPAFRKV